MQSQAAEHPRCLDPEQRAVNAGDRAPTATKDAAATTAAEPIGSATSSMSKEVYKRQQNQRWLAKRTRQNKSSRRHRVQWHKNFLSLSSTAQEASLVLHPIRTDHDVFAQEESVRKENEKSPRSGLRVLGGSSWIKSVQRLVLVPVSLS